MDKNIEIIRKGRGFILELVKELSQEQLNKIPAGFSNNIIWNLGHLVAAQQGVCYKRPGIDLVVPEEFFDAYKPGSKPEGFVGGEEAAQIRELLFSTLDRLETDRTAGLMDNYPPWTTRYGVELGSINEAIAFLPFHEGMHIGIIMALKKLVI